LNDHYRDNVERAYAGYDMRLGFMYTVNDMVTAGARLEFPKKIAFEECGTQSLPSAGSLLDYELTGHLSSSYNGAVGISCGLPFGTVTAEALGGAPFVEKSVWPSHRHWNKGGAAGVELPIAGTSCAVRGGYRWRQVMMYPYKVYYDAAVESEYSSEPQSWFGEHTISAGFVYRATDMVSFELGCAQRMYSLEKAGVLEETDCHQRAVATVGVRF
jgi:hypothetical protein